MTTATKEQQPLAEFAMRGGEDVVPAGYMKEGDKGQDDTGNYTIEDLAYKGYVKVWDNRTGVMSYQPRWLLWQTVQLKRPDGSVIFTDKDPGIAQNYGLDLVCLLHPDSPDFPQLKAMGFRPCYKKHTPTKVALDDHMKHSHKRAYAAMASFMDEQRRMEDRALQMEAIRSNQELIRAMAGNMRPQVMATPVPRDSEMFAASCSKCHRNFEGETVTKARSKLKLHKRFCKG